MINSFLISSRCTIQDCYFFLDIEFQKKVNVMYLSIYDADHSEII